MGDVWLTKDFSRENGYDLRIDVAECCAWEMKGQTPQTNNRERDSGRSFRNQPLK